MEIGNLKIALCITGQPRTWKKCYRSWFDNISHLGKIDTFYHMWNYNTLPSIVANNNDQLITDDEISQIKIVLDPKAYLIEPKREFPKFPVDHQIAWWTTGQFYSIKKCAYLKRKYEIEMDFEYDLVFRLRTDLFLRDKIFIDTPLALNSVYTCANKFDDEYDKFRIADIFYYGNSYVYDQVSAFYDIFRYVDAYQVIAGRDDYPPELAFYYYLKSRGISNRTIHLDCKIARTQQYSDIRGGLANYETL